MPLLLALVLLVPLAQADSSWFMTTEPSGDPGNSYILVEPGADHPAGVVRLPATLPAVAPASTAFHLRPTTSWVPDGAATVEAEFACGTFPRPPVPATLTVEAIVQDLDFAEASVDTALQCLPGASAGTVSVDLAWPDLIRFDEDHHVWFTLALDGLNLEGDAYDDLGIVVTAGNASSGVRFLESDAGFPAEFLWPAAVTDEAASGHRFFVSDAAYLVGNVTGNLDGDGTVAFEIRTLAGEVLWAAVVQGTFLTFSRPIAIDNVDDETLVVAYAADGPRGEFRLDLRPATRQEYLDHRDSFIPGPGIVGLLGTLGAGAFLASRRRPM